MDGHVVGINSAIASLGAAQGTEGGSIGLGFAIPIDQAKRIADQLQPTGTATKAVLGVATADAAGGAKLTQVATDGATAHATVTLGSADIWA
jgi:putative serine protease PepD